MNRMKEKKCRKMERRRGLEDEKIEVVKRLGG